MTGVPGAEAADDPGPALTLGALAVVLAAVPDATVVVDEAGRILLADPQAHELFGFADATLGGADVDELLPGRFGAAHAEHRRRRHHEPRARPNGAGIALPGRRRDGSEFPAEVTLASVALDGAEVVLATVRDLSHRTGQQARERLAAVVESSADAILAKDRDGTVTDWNHAAERLYGHTREEMVGRSVMTIVPPDRVSETEQTMARVLSGEIVEPYETVRLGRTGERLPVSVTMSPLRDAEGEVVGASTIARDIRARLEADAQRAYTHALFENTADAIVATDAAGVITAWNPAATRLFGYEPHEALGRPAAAVIGPEVSDAQAAGVPEAAIAGGSSVYETVRTDRAGNDRHLSIARSPIRDGRGRVSGLVGIIRDTTAAVHARTVAGEAVRREEELRDELNQARRLESIGQLAGGVAHDFNNLLGVIINYTQFVADALPEGSPVSADVAEIQRAAERGADLTRQLLIFSRREVVRPEVLDANALIRELESLLRRALGERVGLRTRLEAPSGRVLADRGQMEQVLVNLAVNGRDAMPDGGLLDIETSVVVVDADDSATHVDLEPGPYVRITVTDSGVGMSPEVMERAFEPFFTTKPKEQGTGLGLATVYGIVKEAQGRVTLYSEGGFGSSVKVYLPATDAAIAVQARAVQPAPRGRGETVLVVEDQPDVRRVTARILTAAGFSVLQAEGGESALALAGAHEIDLMLTDVVMPGMLGPELVEEAARRHPRLRFVFMSGYSDQVLPPELLRGLGAGGYVEKPFTAVELQTRVREALDG